MRRLLSSVVAVLAILVAPGVAEAGYAVQPQSGSTTNPTPSFLVYLDGNDSYATVYVSRSPQVSGSGLPADLVGSCSYFSRTSETNKYTCRPSVYYTTGTDRLEPGTYYWWLTFWRTDPGAFFGSIRVSGPLMFTVLPPTPPPNTGLVAPSSASVIRGTDPTFAVRLREGASATVYVSSDSEWSAELGRPAGGVDGSCETGAASVDGVYRCSVSALYLLDGATYYWWAVIDDPEAGGWYYGPWHFDYREAVSTGSGGSAGGSSRGSVAKAVSIRSALTLRGVNRWRGVSAHHKRLSSFAYRFSKWWGKPKTVAVACWSDKDWPSVVSDPESYLVNGLWSPRLPRWLHLSPGTCRALETLLSHRPVYPNPILAGALDTFTHELLHALGSDNEALTECLSIQTTDVMGEIIGLPRRYRDRLGRLTLREYAKLEARYRDPRCVDGGRWDLWPKKPSPPWSVWV